MLIGLHYHQILRHILVLIISFIFFSLSLDCFLPGGRAFLEGGPWLASCCSSPSGAASCFLLGILFCLSDANFSQCLTLSQQWTSWKLFPLEALAYLAWASIICNNRDIAAGITAIEGIYIKQWQDIGATTEIKYMFLVRDAAGITALDLFIAYLE